MLRCPRAAPPTHHRSASPLDLRLAVSSPPHSCEPYTCEPGAGMDRGQERARQARGLRRWTLVVALMGSLGLVSSTVHAQPYRSIDGTDNNLAQPTWGAAGIPLLRVAPADYADGVSAMSGLTRPDPRTISNVIVLQSDLIPNSYRLSDMLWQWGQFVDHDLSLTEAQNRLLHPGEVADIPVPAGDPFFDPFGMGTAIIPFTRSQFVPGSSPRIQSNVLTAYIDASNVYGSDAVRAQALRRLDGSGKLKTSTGNLLPFNLGGLPNAPTTAPSFFLAGDVRCNEQAALAAMHTLWVREHNRLCDEIALATPGLDDEEIYQRARQWVGALMQVITYEEFLPALLGPGALTPYTGYDPGVNPGVATEFSTVAFRIGHTLLSSQVLRCSELGTPIDEGHLALADAFFNLSSITTEGGIDPLLRGLAAQYAQRVDNLIVNDVRSFLFGPPGAGGLDLSALNIQRGRDHGVPGYNALRVAYGLAPQATFADVTSVASVQAALSVLYNNPDEVDGWVGGLAEDHAPGAHVGELFLRIIGEQFERVRDGDRYWYELIYSGAQLTELRSTRLADVIRRNTQILGISDDVFRVPDFRRGDCNQDQVMNVADAIRLLDYLFQFQLVQPTIGCEDACDFNDDGTLDISDAIRVIAYLFAGGAPLPGPSAGCGPDPTPDAVGCYRFVGCP